MIMKEVNIILVVIGFIFIGIGFLVVRCPMLIAGYNTMPKKQREKVDIKGLSLMMRNYLAAMGICTIVVPYLFTCLGWNTWAGASPVLIILGLAVLMSIKGRKYTKNAGKVVKSKADIALIKVQIVVLGIVCSIVVGMLIALIVPATVKVDESQISISGMYGTNIPFSNIKDIKLQHTLSITLRTNGSALGPYCKGHFRVKDMGSCLLFLSSADPPFIVITLEKGKTVILNRRITEETEKLFEKMRINLN